MLRRYGADGADRVFRAYEVREHGRRVRVARRRNRREERSLGGERERDARVRALIAEDTRTKDLPPVSIGGDDGMAWVDGSVPSPEAKEALTDVVAGAEGVNIVVNRTVIRRS